MTTYRLQAEETLDAGVKRIVGELVDEARTYLSEDDPERMVQAVHETRKLCKKGRGLVRLVRPGLGDGYDVANRLFRDAARELSPIRDPQALLQTFDDLASVPGLVPEGGLMETRSALARRSADATARVLRTERDRIERAAEMIESARAGARSWDLPDEFGPVGEGVAKTYVRGRERSIEAGESRHAEVFHEWRKRVKYLWYQIRLLRNAAPSVLRPLANRLHDLSDALGDAHDLVVMGGVVEEIEIDDRERTAITTMTSGMRFKLEERALSLGRRLYVESPDAFVNRLEGYWEAWQRGEEMEAGEIADLFPAEDRFENMTFDDLYEDAAAAEVPGRSEMDKSQLVSNLRVADIKSTRSRSTNTR